ncbi:hypothetical protein GJ496_004396 [Pomphorhynchus laevis]|nr:hypothetical protein GJ496_004396 [Pomphorhynchus laevis]
MPRRVTERTQQRRDNYRERRNAETMHTDEYRQRFEVPSIGKPTRFSKGNNIFREMHQDQSMKTKLAISKAKNSTAHIESKLQSSSTVLSRN